MTTRTQLRTTIRAELNEASAAIWTDSLLNEFIARAIREYSRVRPLHTSTTITAVADQTAYALPARFLQVVRLEQPAENLRWHDPGQESANGYRVTSTQLVLEPAPTSAGSDQDLVLEYLAYYTEPSADGDTISTPASEDDVLVSFACHYAMRYLDSDEAKRQAYTQRRGVSSETLADVYWQRAMEVLERLNRQVHVSRLVADSYEPPRVRQSTDPGP